MRARPGVHSVTTRQAADGRWVAACTCGEGSPGSTHKPVVEQWRKAHYDTNAPTRPRLRGLS